MAIRASVNVSITPELEEFVQSLVASGRYHSASEVVRDALRLLRRHDELTRIEAEELRREIQLGLDDLEQGRVVDGEQAFEEIRRMSRERRRKSA